MWSRVFLAPSLQPMSHSPQSRQVRRVVLCRFPYSGGGMICFMAGAPCGVAEKEMASGGWITSSPSASAASRSALVFGRSG